MDALTGSALVSAERLLFSSTRPALNPNLLPKTLRYNNLTLASRSASPKALSIRAASSPSPSPSRSPLSSTLRSAGAGALVLTAAAVALLSAKLSPPPARAEPSAPLVAEERAEDEAEIQGEQKTSPPSVLSQFLESNSDAVGSLRSLLYRKLDEGEDSEALDILRRLMAAQPAETEWKFLAARLLNEMGEAAESRRLFEEILAVDPFSFEALFENAVLMDRCGDGSAVIERLERALELARSEQKEKAARDVRLIMAQIQFLQKNVDQALTSYEELAREDPKDYRPYFCQGVIYSLLDRNKDAREKFSKYHELSPKKFDVDAYLQTSLSRVKLFGTGDSEI